jgi:hypothetical protein
MSWMDEIGGLVQQYEAGQHQAAPAGQVEQHYDQVAQSAPCSVIASGLADAFRSGGAGGFGQIASQLFGNSGGGQQANLLNTLLSTAGPGLEAALASGNLPGLSSILGGGGGAPRQLTPEEAAQVPQQEIQHLANHVQNNDPSIVDRVGEIYAEHPGVVKSLGSEALALAMSKISQRATA